MRPGPITDIHEHVRTALSRFDLHQATKQMTSSCGDRQCSEDKSAPDRYIRRETQSLQQVYDSVGQSLFAEYDVQVAGGRDTFQDFQFPEPHQSRVVRQHLGRTTLRAVPALTAHGGRLFAA